ncbi:MAG TPA: NADH-quinone oxidoreductase subunit M, partial [Phaeodactylibacter sp.]|nr:NADH-quinone oxidoreductase subunit M [Phaeodactylibacter sp.]
MDILTSLVVVPVLTVLALFFAKDLRQARTWAAIGTGIELLLAIWLTVWYLQLRGAGHTEEMLFMRDVLWFKSLNIHYAIGVDGISVALILLTAIVLFAGVFISWHMQELSKEFFISLIVLGTGVFGFFISLDLFTMFLFYELAVIPMYLLIGIWGTGPREYAAMKLTLMLMAGSAFLLVGILGLYFNSAPEGGQLTFNILEIARLDLPMNMQRF